MPRVSVILPNYNYARYLKERVRSILNQTMTDFELIYVDDASTDASNRIMEPFAADPRVRMVLHAQNSGRVYQRWHEAAEQATGDWLWFAGADDSAHPEFLEKLLVLASAHPSAAVLHCRIALIDSDGRLIRTHSLINGRSPEYLDHDYFVSGYVAVARMIELMYLSTASTMLIRRDAYLANGGWDIRLWKSADWNLYNSILHEYDIAYTVEHLASYRYHPQTVTRTTRYVIARMEDAYCVARAYSWMKADPRCTPEMRTYALCQLRAMVIEIFADPSASVPVSLDFAAREIYSHVPERRLLRFT